MGVFDVDTVTRADDHSFLWGLACILLFAGVFAAVAWGLWLS
jgi:hypothetical protein